MATQRTLTSVLGDSALLHSNTPKQPSKLFPYPQPPSPQPLPGVKSSSLSSLKSAGIIQSAASLPEPKKAPAPAPLVSPAPRTWPLTSAQVRVHARVHVQRSRLLHAFSNSDESSHQRRTKRLENCCVAPLLVSRSDGRIITAPGFCRDRMCPTCQALRGRNVEARVRQMLCEMDQVRFLTLTLRHSDAPLREQLDRLYKSFRTLRQHPDWKRLVKGGCAVCEITFNLREGQWHPHLHILIDGEYMPHALIKSLWLSITGDSDVVHIKAVHSRDAGAKYIATYVAKPAEVERWTDARVLEYADALHGRRLLVAFGSMHAPKEKTDELGQTPQLVEVLCSSLAVHAAFRRGCLYGRLASELLSASGWFNRRLFGPAVATPDFQPRELTDADRSELRIALRRIAGDSSAWLPRLEPQRRFEGVSHAGSRGKVQTIPLFANVARTC